MERTYLLIKTGTVAARGLEGCRPLRVINHRHRHHTHVPTTHLPIVENENFFPIHISYILYNNNNICVIGMGIFIVVRADRRENFDARSQYIYIYILLPILFQTRRTRRAHIILRTHIHRDRNII